MAAARPKLVAVPGARCVHGHDLAMCGVYVHKNGTRICRECERQRDRIRRGEIRAAEHRGISRRRAPDISEYEVNSSLYADPNPPDADAVERRAALIHAMLAPEREHRFLDRVPQLVRVGA